MINDETDDLTYSEAIEQVMLHNDYVAPLKLIYKEIWNYKDKSKIKGKTPDMTIQERSLNFSKPTFLISSKNYKNGVKLKS